MKRLAIAALLFSSTVNAQGIPTYDNARFVQDTAQYATVLRYWIDQYDQLVKQYIQLQKTHEAISGVRNLGDVFDDPTLRKYLPRDMRHSYSAFKRSGYEGLVRTGADILADNHIHDVCAKYEDRQIRKNCESTIAHNAQSHGDLEEAYKVIEARSEQIAELQAQINQTEDPKAIAELQARIASELTDISNERTKIAVSGQLNETQHRLDADRQRQFNQRTLSNTKGFSSDLEIPTFER